MTADESLSAEALSKAQFQAILNLDFERAVELSRQKTRIVDHTAVAELAHYQAEADRLVRENEEHYNEKVQGISQDFLAHTSSYKTIWQKLCRALISRQKAEAADLEQRWHSARDLEAHKQADVAHVQLGTARILAMCDKFDEAIEARNHAQSLLTDDHTPGLRKIDADYTKQYRGLISRHELEFKDLFTHLNSLIKALKDKAEGQKSAARALLLSQNASNARVIIESVAQHQTSQSARDTIIQAFSPRYRKPPPLKI
jgi:hypothetical protein